MTKGYPAPKVTLTADERSELETCTRRSKTARLVAQRARAILMAADGTTNVAIADHLKVTRATVGKWRQRFVKTRLAALYDEPRPGAPRKISDAAIEAMIAKTLETKPRKATHWSTKLMAAESGISKSQVYRIWQAFGLKPHLSETFKLSQDPLFVVKVRDVVGLYMAPPERAMVLCVDEKTQVQALDRTRPLLPMRPGQVERRTHDYERHGTTSLFAALDVKTGKVIGRCHGRHRAKEFLGFLKMIDESVPADIDVHLVLDNASTHKTPKVKRWLLRRPRYHLHFTPTSSSWLNLVERFFSALTEQQIRRGVHRSTKALIAAIEDYIAATNENPKPFVWTKSADEILQSLGGYCARINGEGH
jgi:transposase